MSGGRVATPIGFLRQDVTGGGDVGDFENATGTVTDGRPSWEANAADFRVSRPSRSVPLQDLGVEHVRLAQPLYVLLEESDGFIVASSYDLELAEQGLTEFDALDQFRAAVVELIDALEESGDDLSDHLKRQRSFLRSVMR
jgi:hypothetical protein